MYIKAVVKAGMKKESLVKKSEDHFEISVKEKAENDMANKRVVKLLAEYFKVSVKKIRMVNGHRHPHKLLFIEI